MKREATPSRPQPDPTRRFYVATFGCRTNQADSAVIREQFLSQQFEETGSWSQADIIVINSCTVTHRSDQQVRQLTRRFHRENPEARIVLTGCYAQRNPGELTCLPGVSLVVGNSHKDELVSLSEKAGLLSGGAVTHQEVAAVFRDDFHSAGPLGRVGSSQTGGRTRPFVKLQDGCDAKCTYCIIPQVRGPSRSFPPEIILAQIRQLIDQGFSEIVLTGIHIGSYGMSFRPRYPLDRLLEKMVSLPGLQRVRLSSIEPMQLSSRITALAARNEKIAPHFHICLQSGSDRILRKMYRPYNTARFGQIVEEIRNHIPEAAIGTDLISGFPGETESDHRQTLEFVWQMPFSYLHVFPYSDRTGTLASELPEKVPVPTIRRRSEELRRLSDLKNKTFRERFLGEDLSVITLSEVRDGMRDALSGNYLKARIDASIPENVILSRPVAREDPDGVLRLS